MTEHRITITENPSIHETRDGSTMCELAPEGFAGWFVERRNPITAPCDEETKTETYWEEVDRRLFQTIATLTDECTAQP